MTNFFTYFPDMFDGSELTRFEYLGPLLIGLIVIVTFYFMKKRFTEKTKKLIIYTLGGILALSEISDKVYVYMHLGWHWDMLSLHLCSISAVVGVFLIFFRPNRYLYGV